MHETLDHFSWLTSTMINMNDPLLGLAYPENLSSIRLMVEAVDTFCGASASASAVPVLGVIIQKTSA